MSGDPQTVMVALRPRIGDYRSAARGVVGDEEPEVLDTFDQADLFYPPFADASVSPSAADAAEPD